MRKKTKRRLTDTIEIVGIGAFIMFIVLPAFGILGYFWYKYLLFVASLFGL